MKDHISKNTFDILLIKPPSIKGKLCRKEFIIPPIGLAYLASFVQRKGITVDIIDCDAEGIYINFYKPTTNQIQKFSKILRNYKKPLLIGIGPVTSPNFINGMAMARYVKNFYHGVYIVIGGPHPSVLPPQMAIKILKQFEYIDSICINEGENTLLELIYKLKFKKSNKKIPGLVSRSSNGFAYIERDLLNSNELNLLPFPNWRLLEKYSGKYKLTERRTFFNILSDKNLVKKYGKNPRFTVIISSHGCPYKCSFCCSSSHRRLRSAENVVNEIENYVINYNIHCFIFYDDLFMISSKSEIERVRDICNIILKKGLEVFWEVELRADVICSLERSVLSLMNKAGCRTINIGIEKATNTALNCLQKGIKIHQFKNAIKKIRSSGHFIINGTFIIGGPTETVNDVLNIIAFSKELNLDYANYSPLHIHPGTKIFNEAKKYNLLDDILQPYITTSNEYPIFTNSQLSSNIIKHLISKAYQEFFSMQN